MVDKKAQGKKNRASGQRFELKVRKDLESKDWIVDKWTNNVVPATSSNPFEWEGGLTLVPAKHKFRGLGIPMAIGTGFPDFIAFRFCDAGPEYGMDFNGICSKEVFYIIGVEVKSNGYLTKGEKDKCEWYLKTNIFSKILIASKGEKRGEIIYKEFEC